MHSVRRFLVWLALLPGLLVLVLPMASAVNQKSTEDYPESPFTAIYSSDPAGGDVSDAQIAKNGEAVGIDVIGHNDLGGGGFNADVWVHRHRNGKRVAYVGQWGFGASQPDKCDPANRRGVKVVDVTDPANPQVVTRLQNPPLTTAEDVEVVTYTRGPFRGRDIAAVGIQACFRLNAQIKRGLQLFDVTDPTNPKEIGFLDTGMAARGVHELTVAVRPDGRVLALLTVPFSDTRDRLGRGDLRIADITDPKNPVEIANWGLATEFRPDEAAAMQLSGQGCFAFRFGHGVIANPAVTRAYVSYWDWGTKVVDITNPALPILIETTGYPANADGDAHSAALAAGGGVLLQADEDLPPPGFCKAPAKHTEAGWGFLRIFDLGQSGTPEIGSFHTPNSLDPSRNRKGDYTIHNPVVVGSKAYLSWYTDGIRVLDISNPTDPIERARFVPAAAKDPQHILPFAAEVWGVIVDEGGLIYASDMNSGLWVLRETNP